MQSGPARSRWRKWLRWGRVLVLGLALGGVQILVLFVARPLEQWATNLWPSVALSAFFYLGIPTLEGFLTARRTEEAFSAVTMGCLVGAIGFFVIAILAAVISVQLLNPPRLVCPPDCPRLYFPPSLIIGLLILPIVVVEGLGGVAGGLLGGWIGGLLGRGRATRLNRGSAPSARALLSEETSGTEALPQ